MKVVTVNALEAMVKISKGFSKPYMKKIIGAHEAQIKESVKNAKFVGDVGKMHARGLSIKAIAKELHASDRRVSAVVHSLPKLREPSIMKADADIVNTIKNLRRHCFTVKQIAKIVHKRDRFVSHVLIVYNEYDSGIADVMRLRKAGLGIKQIAKRLKISDKIVSRVVRMHCAGCKKEK